MRRPLPTVNKPKKCRGLLATDGFRLKCLPKCLWMESRGAEEGMFILFLDKFPLRRLLCRMLGANLAGGLVVSSPISGCVAICGLGIRF